MVGRPMMVVTQRKTSPEYNSDPRITQIDTLQRISREARDAYLGQGWFKQASELFDLKMHGGAVPSFRPTVSIPQLQILMLSEAVDLSDSSPRIYLADFRTGKRNEERERAFQQQWRQAQVNYHLLYATLWAQFAGVGWLQLGMDLFANDGLGELWVRHRSPDTVDVDPGGLCYEDLTYIIINDRLYSQQLRAAFPETGRAVEPRAQIGPRNTSDGAPAGAFSLPEGPMSIGSGLSPTPGAYSYDSRLDVRYTFINDNTIEAIHDEAGSAAAQGLKSIYRRAYPKGRYLVDADRVIVADGDNPTPKGRFPVIPVYGLPNLTNFYAPPPPRFSIELQDLAGRFLTQMFENAVRVNNGIWFIDDDTNIDTEQFGGLPGEVQVVSAKSRLPEFKQPNAFHPQMFEVPGQLLKLQKELQGFTSSREGSPGAGNISPELFEASVFQSKRLTRLRAKLQARSVQWTAEQLYALMVKYITKERYYPEVSDEFRMVKWAAPTAEDSSLMVYLDEVSLLPVSQAALRTMAPMLRQAGALDLRSFLEFLEVPGAEEIAGRVDREQMLAALNKLRRR